MTTHFRALLGTDHIGTVAAAQLLAYLATPSRRLLTVTRTTALRHFFSFCAEEGLPPLHATHATMVFYTA
jgi:hypothetical protein